MKRVTFTFDRETESALARLAERRGASKSSVVREAVLELEARGDELTFAERHRRLRALDEWLRSAPKRPRSEAEDEVKAVREARRASSKRRP